jgi:hypothetical protein
MRSEFKGILNQLRQIMGDQITTIEYGVRDPQNATHNTATVPNVSSPTDGLFLKANVGHVNIENRPDGEKGRKVSRTRNCVIWRADIDFTPRVLDTVTITEDGKDNIWIVEKAETDQSEGTWLLHLRLS